MSSPPVRNQRYQPLPDVRKIVVLRANAIGDFFFALPALEALRATYPEAEIVLLGQRWHAGFLDGRPSPVDRVVVVPDNWLECVEGKGEDAAFDRFVAAMQAEEFDLGVQIFGGGQQSNRLIAQLRPRFSVGLKTPEAPAPDRWIPYRYWQREILRYLEVVALVGARPHLLEPMLTVTERDLCDAYAVVPDDAPSLVVIHPGAGDPRRRWAPASFAAVGDSLAADGVRVAVTGVAAEAEIVAEVVDRMAAPALNLAGRLSLEGLAGLLYRSALAVSNDSGPLHLAAAVGARTVGLYWAGNIVNGGPMSRARNIPILSWQMECSVCQRHVIYDPCEHSASFLGDIKTEEVIAAARELLAAARETAA